MLRRGTTTFFKVSPPQDVRGTVVRAAGAPPRRHRQFVHGTPSSSGDPTARAGQQRPLKHSFIPPQCSRSARQSVGRVIQGGQEHGASPFPDATSHTSSHHQATAEDSGSGATSQRQRFRRQQFRQEDKGVSDMTAPASLLSPLPKKYGFYDGIDAHALEPVRPSPALRQRMLRQALEEQAASVVEFTDGGENDIDLGGMPASEYHGQEGWTTIPRDSALYNSTFGAQELESRQRLNSWGVARRRRQAAATTAETNVGTSTAPTEGLSHVMGEYAAAGADAQARGEHEVLDDVRRRKHHDEGAYTNMLEGELLEPTPASVGPPRSVYGLRKLFIKGLVGYQGIISRAEEAAVAEELLHLLQDPRAAYIAEETRYCVNLYETELGVPGKDTLAFPIHRAPALQKVLYRLFFLGLIPSPPNVIQVSEMVGNFSGYPVHRKPRAIGSYVGILNLVSTTVMHMQHVDCPWYPRLHMNPRSLFVISEPCLSEYAMGYKQTHQPFHAFEYATRVSKDYRIEVMFATVETEHMRHLNEAVQLTEYAEERLLARSEGGSAPPSTSSIPKYDGVSHTSVDSYLERLRQQLHETTEDADEQGNRQKNTVVIDGHALRRQLQEAGMVGSRSQPLSSTPSAAATGQGGSPASSTAKSAAQRRLAALKARHEFAKHLKGEGVVSKESGRGGHQLIRGQAPGDNRQW